MPRTRQADVSGGANPAFSPDTFTDLLPPSVAADVVAGVADRASAVMSLARLVRMPTGTQIVPVISSAPAAGWVDPQVGLKPHGEVGWEPLTLSAGEIGVIVALPDASSPTRASRSGSPSGAKSSPPSRGCSRTPRCGGRTPRPPGRAAGSAMPPSPSR